MASGEAAIEVGCFPTAPTSVVTVAQVIQLAVAPVFLLAGIGAFLNVCAGRLSRIVDRARTVEPLLLRQPRRRA